jgi:hypothetical protein
VRRYAAFEHGEIANPLPEMVESVGAFGPDFRRAA